MGTYVHTVVTDHIVRINPTPGRWVGAIARVAAFHERHGFPPPRVFGAEARRLGVTEGAVRRHYAEAARKLVRHAAVRLGPVERDRIRGLDDFLAAGQYLRSVGFKAPQVALEAGMLVAPGFELVDLKARERARRAVAS